MPRCLAWTILLICPLAPPAGAHDFGAKVAPYFAELATQGNWICGLDGVEESLLFSPPTGTTIYVAEEMTSEIICAEVYEGMSYKGTLWLSPQKEVARWSSVSGQVTVYDLSVSTTAQQVASSHDLRSMAVSALLHWEEEKVIIPVPNAACEAQPNGCSVPINHCNGISIAYACDRHDRCYQCGWESGKTRADCDLEFFYDIYATTGDGACANTFYWGVRLAGWLFFREDSVNRLHYWGDVYALGISMNACSGTQYERMCTTYLF